MDLELDCVKCTKWEERIEPCMEFESEEQAYQCLDYWQEKLFLHDWIFKLYLAKPESLDRADEEVSVSGRIDFTFSQKCGVIQIVELTDDTRNRIVKICHEKVLIHELLHANYNWLAPPSSYEGMYVEEKEHQLLEQMAKSLLMVRYGLDYNWFINFTRKEWKNDSSIEKAPT